MDAKEIAKGVAVVLIALVAYDVGVYALGKPGIAIPAL